MNQKIKRSIKEIDIKSKIYYIGVILLALVAVIAGIVTKGETIKNVLSITMTFLWISSTALITAALLMTLMMNSALFILRLLCFFIKQFRFVPC